MAEVGEIGGLVHVGVAAAAAVLGIRGVLQLGERERVVLDAVVERLAAAAEVAHQRVVGVEHEARGGGQALDDLCPAVGDDLELAVAVELVAEQVAEQHGARREVGGHRAEPELVDLEQAHVAAPGGERGGHAAGHVGSRPIVDEARAGAAEDRGDHRRRRRLPVGGGDDHASARQPGGEAGDGPRFGPHQHLAGQRGAAAPGHACGGCRDAGRQQAGLEPQGAITRNAPGTTRAVAGRSAIGSPSA
jgi:hypothetical protein